MLEGKGFDRAAPAHGRIGIAQANVKLIADFGICIEKDANDTVIGPRSSLTGELGVVGDLGEVGTIAGYFDDIVVDDGNGNQKTVIFRNVKRPDDLCIVVAEAVFLALETMNSSSSPAELTAMVKFS